MRFVRSEENKRTCLVFLNFESVKQTALFYKAYNGKAVSPMHLALELRSLTFYETRGTEETDLSRFSLSVWS